MTLNQCRNFSWPKSIFQKIQSSSEIYSAVFKNPNIHQGEPPNHQVDSQLDSGCSPIIVQWWQLSRKGTKLVQQNWRLCWIHGRMILCFWYIVFRQIWVYKISRYSSPYFTAWKVSVFRVFLVSIFPYLTECGEIQSISLYSVRMRENTIQKNSECGYFSRSVSDPVKYLLWNILWK